MYLIINEGVAFGTFYYEDSAVTHYFVENSEGCCLEIDYDLWFDLQEADGSNPIFISNKNKRVLRTLKRHGIISTSRFINSTGLFNRFVLFTISNSLCKLKGVFTIINRCLLALSLVSLFIGLTMTTMVRTPDMQILLLGPFFGLCVVSLAMHEVGHLIAGIACGYKINNIGVLFIWLIPIGVYTSYEDRDIKNRKERIQFSLSGIEANVSIAGICLVTALLRQSVSFTLVSVAKFNIILAGLNLIPAFGLDGEAALSAIFGVDSISALAMRCLLNRELRNKFLSSGWNGRIRLFGLLVILMCNFLPWLIIGYEGAYILVHIF